MSLRGLTIAALVASMGLPATAQQQITAQAFLDKAVGKTLTFSNRSTGTVVGTEQFLRRDLSVWVGRFGRCTYGKIVIDGPLMCFIYEDDPNEDNCWMPFMKDDRLLVMHRTSFEIQEITRISTQTLGCPDQPVS